MAVKTLVRAKSDHYSDRSDFLPMDAERAEAVDELATKMRIGGQCRPPFSPQGQSKTCANGNRLSGRTERRLTSDRDRIKTRFLTHGQSPVRLKPLAGYSTHPGHNNSRPGRPAHNSRGIPSNSDTDLGSSRLDCPDSNHRRAGRSNERQVRRRSPARNWSIHCHSYRPSGSPGSNTTKCRYAIDSASDRRSDWLPPRRWHCWKHRRLPRRRAFGSCPDCRRLHSASVRPVQE